jgi:hypothetical protein
MHLTVYLGMYHFLILLMDNHGAVFCKDDISNPKVCRSTYWKHLREAYSKDSGLFTVPTRIILVVAPINALLNYVLGELLPCP